MGNYTSLPAAISTNKRNWGGNFGSAIDRHQRGREVLEYLGKELPDNVQKSIVSKLDNTRYRYDDLKSSNADRKNMNNTADDLNNHIDWVTTTVAKEISDRYQSRVDTAIQNNQKFKNYSDVYGKSLVIPQAEIDTANTYIKNFRDAVNATNAAKAVDVNILIDKWNGWNNYNPVAQQWLVDKAREAKTNADNKIADLELYGNFQGTANTLRDSSPYKNIEWYKGQYLGNLSNGTHTDLDNVSNQLNEATEKAGHRAANDKGVLDRSTNAKTAADNKIKDLQRYGEYFKDIINTLVNSAAYKDRQFYWDDYHRTPTNTTHQNLENSTTELDKAVAAADRAVEIKGYIDRAVGQVNRAKEINKKLETAYSKKYGSNYINYNINNIEQLIQNYINDPNNDTNRINIQGNTTGLEQIIDGSDQTPKINQGLIDAANTALGTADAKNATLDNYWEYNDRNKYPRIDVQRLKDARDAYNANPTNTTHDAIVNITNEVNNSNVTQVTAHPHFVQAAQSVIDTAKSKNDQLKAYNKFYNQYNDYGPLEAELTAFKLNPSSSLHGQMFGNDGNNNYEKLRLLNAATNITPNANLLTNADAAKTAADAKIANLELYKKYGDYQSRANELKNSKPYKNIDWYKNTQYLGNTPTNATHTDLENVTKELNDAVTNAGVRAANDRGLLDRAGAAIKKADDKIKDLEKYSKNFQVKIDELTKQPFYGFDYVGAYNSYPSNETHENLDGAADSLSKAADNAGSRYAEHTINTNATNVINAADAKNATLDNYVDYRDPNKFPRIDVQSLRDALKRYNDTPTNETHDALVAKTNEINGTNVAQITAHPHSLGLIQNEIDTAIQKNAQLVAYSDAYGNVAQNDYKLLEAQLIAFKAKPNTPLHDEIFGINPYPEGNFTKVQNRNKNINITPSADLISNADTQLAAGRAKSEEYQKNPAYVNYGSSLTKPIDDCQAALTEYKTVQNNTTAKKLRDTTAALQTAIGEVPVITTPKPTPIQDLLTKADAQLDAGDTLRRSLQNNLAYVNYVSYLTTPINNCTAAYTAYTDNPNDTTANNLRDTTAALKIAIGEVPIITTPVPASTYGNSISFTSTPYDSTPYTSTPYTSTPYTSTPYDSTPYPSTPYASTPYPSTPYPSTSMYGDISTSEVTMHPEANPIVVNNIKIQIDSAIAFADEIRNFKQSTTEANSPDFESQINEAKSKYQAYKINPTVGNLSALVESAKNLSETMNSLKSVPISNVVNAPEFVSILGPLSSIFTPTPSPSLSTYGTTSSPGPSPSTYGTTSSPGPSMSTYGTTSSLGPSMGTYGPTSSLGPSMSTYGTTSSLGPSPSTYGTTTNITSSNRFISITPLSSLAYNAVDSAPRPTFNNAIANSLGARPTFNYAISNAPANNYGSSCPTFNCAPYQTTVPPTTKPHKCQTCHSCRRCHKCNKNHKCHRKTPTNTTTTTNKR